MSVLVGPPVELDIDWCPKAASTATAVVTASQNGKRRITITVLADVLSGDVIRHQLPGADVVAPAKPKPGIMGDDRSPGAAGGRRRRQQPR